jgi:pimeloyl-ACP methyl ester carboxylesterase
MSTEPPLPPLPEDARAAIAAAPAGEELALAADGAALAALAWGPATGRRVLGLHGWLDNAATFAPLAAQLPALRLVALDFPGHGRSAHRSIDAVYHFVDWAPDVVRALDALGWERATLLGHSMGGGVAALVAAALPDRVDAVIGLEGLVGATHPETELPKALARYVKARRGLRGKALPTYATFEEALAARLASGDYAHPDGIRHVVARGLAQRGDGRWAWRTDPRLTLPSPMRLTPGQARAVRDAIAAPTRVVVARRGIARDPEYAAVVRDLSPRIERVEVDGYHHVHLDDPATVAAAIRPVLTP